jgi:hypothetical protein
MIERERERRKKSPENSGQKAEGTLGSSTDLRGVNERDVVI